jgi:hypothetical protein
MAPWTLNSHKATQHYCVSFSYSHVSNFEISITILSSMSCQMLVLLFPEVLIFLILYKTMSYYELFQMLENHVTVFSHNTKKRTFWCHFEQGFLLVITTFYANHFQISMTGRALQTCLIFTGCLCKAMMITFKMLAILYYLLQVCHVDSM